MTTIPVTDLLATVVSAVALVVTVVLVVIGVRIGSDIRSLAQRLRQLEQIKEGETREIRAFRSIAELLRRQWVSSFKFDMEVYSFLSVAESAGHEPKFTRERVVRTFVDGVGLYRRESERYLSYLLLMKEVRIEEFQVRLSNVTQIYRDEMTVSFLEAILPLFGVSHSRILEQEIASLRRQLRGFDASSWTGASS